MSDQVSAQFRRWVGLDIAMEQMVYTVWRIYYKHCNIEGVILIAVYFVLIRTQRCLLILLRFFSFYNYNCGEYNYTF